METGYHGKRATHTGSSTHGVLREKLALWGERFASLGLDADQRGSEAPGNRLRDYFSQLLNLIHSNSGSAKGRRE